MNTDPSFNSTMARDFIADLPKNNPCRTLVIAEAGVHHHCSLAIAKKLIKAAAAAGADAIKFQTYKAASLATDWAPAYWQQAEGSGPATQFAYFKQRDKFNFRQYQALSDYAKSQGILFCSTPFDLKAVDWLQEMDMPFWKIASADITNFPLLAAVAATSKPVILSTGASYFEEIEQAVDFLRARGAKDLALLHCNLAYPTPNVDANLLRICKLKRRFSELIIGYSDHCIPDPGVTVPILAVGLGAKIVEKHFSLDRTLPEDDHLHSVDPALLRAMIQRIKIAEEATAVRGEVTASELPARQHARRSVVASRHITAGVVISEEMLTCKRPGGGLPPAALSTVLGRRAACDIDRDNQIRLDHLE